MIYFGKWTQQSHLSFLAQMQAFMLAVDLETNAFKRTIISELWVGKVAVKNLSFMHFST